MKMGCVDSTGVLNWYLAVQVEFRASLDDSETHCTELGEVIAGLKNFYRKNVKIPVSP